MSAVQSSHLDIAVASIQCFTDDGTLDQGEVKYLLGIALRDGVVDDEEKRVLGNIFSKVSSSDVCSDTWTLIQNAKAKHGIN
jgi:hypothetical protein